MNIKENKLIQYLITSRAELSKVTWPTKHETIKYTLIVIGISVTIAVLFGALDFVFSKGVSSLINLNA